MTGHLSLVSRHTVLIVDPDPAVARVIARGCAAFASVRIDSDFVEARAHLLGAPPDVLVANLRLEEYNGLHLVLLASESRLRTRCVVHTAHPDFQLAREGQALGAFFERTDRLQYALPPFIRASLPAADRRDPERYDRRTTPRGGRRAADAMRVAPARDRLGNE